jgi:two pore calcium channel protein 3
MDAERLLRAQTYMEDAMAGKQSLLQTDIKTVVSYRFYHSWYMYSALSSIVVAHLCLIFFEKPNGDLNTQLPVGAACAIEILCLAFYVFRIVHYRNLMSSRKFWGDRKNVVLVAVLAICAVDTLQFLVVEGMNMNGVRFSRILRPLIYINFADFRQVRRGIRSMRKTIVAVGNVIVLLLLTIALFMLLFVKLFQFREWVDKSGKPYFASYSDAYFDLYVLMTSANFPDIMMPAIDHNYVYAFAFIIYFILATYIFLAIILASVYNNYRKHLKDEIEELIKTRRVRSYCCALFNGVLPFSRCKQIPRTVSDGGGVCVCVWGGGGNCGRVCVRPNI